MPRVTSVTYEKVAAACSAVLARSQSLTFEHVYSELKRRGSAEVVSRYIKEFRAKERLGLLGEPREMVVPEVFLTEVALELAERCWTSAVAYNEDAYADRYARHAAQISCMEETVAAAESARKAADERTDKMKVSLEVAEARSAGQLGQIAALERANKDLGSQRDQLAAENTRQESLISEMQGRLIQESERHELALTALRAQYEQTLLREKEREEGSRKAMLVKIDEARQETLQAQRDAAAAAKNMICREDALRSKLAKAEQDYAEAVANAREEKTRTAAREATIASARDTIKGLRKDLDEARSKGSMQEQRLDTLLRQIDETRIRLEAQTERAENLSRELALWESASASGGAQSPDQLREHFARHADS